MWAFLVDVVDVLSDVLEVEDIIDSVAHCFDRCDELLPFADHLLDVVVFLQFFAFVDKSHVQVQDQLSL